MLNVVRIALLILAVLWIVATLLPLIRLPYWWIRMFDFPRLQISTLAVLTLVGLAVVLVGFGSGGRLDWTVFAGLVLAVGFQAYQILPYTGAWNEQVLRSVEGASEERRIRLVISNVLMENRDGERWLRVVREAEPDVVAAVETDEWWTETARELDEALPHAVEVPQDDTYGMLVRTRFPILESEVRNYLEENVPSLHLTLQMDSGEPMKLVILHPRPPRPDIGQDSRLRDAELVMAGREVATFDEPTVVAGDLNDVAWSRTTKMFQKLSGLLDPRIGRGMFSTFHADHRWLRYPLDHVFHSDDLALVEIKRLESVGSDHFPMLIELAVDPAMRPVQDGPDADSEDREEAEEAVDDATDQLQEESASEKQERHREDQ